jgi:hypothetical protein
MFSVLLMMCSAEINVADPDRDPVSSLYRDFGAFFTLDPGPVPFWPLDPGWVKYQDPDPGPK